LKSISILGSYANGNLTTGIINMGAMTPAKEANHNFTDRDGTNNCRFVGRPDSVAYWAKFTQGTYEENKSVPDRGRLHALLHGDYNYQDPYASDDDTEAYLVAEAKVYTTTSASDWTRFVGAFDYKTGTAAYTNYFDPSATTYMLASFTTNETPGASYGDVFIIDDVEFIYNSQLSDLQVNGATVSGFDRDTYTYTIDAEYDASSTTVSFTANGVAATATGSYDESTYQYTIVVNGQNISEDATNTHTYVLQFNKPTVAAATLSSVEVGGMAVELTEGQTEYTLPYAYNAGIAVEATSEDGTIVTTSDYGYEEQGIYDDDAKTITVQVKNASGSVTEYVFHFTDAKTTSDVGGTYPGALSVVLTANGEKVVTPLENTDITLTENQDGTYNVVLKNFTFSMLEMLVGDIYVPALAYDATAGTISGTRTVRLYSENEEAIGLMLGHLPVSVTFTLDDITNKYTDGSIDIITTESESEMVTMFEGIHVDYVPFQIDEEAAKATNADDVSCYREQTLKGYVSKASTAFLQINNDVVGVPMNYIDMTACTVADDVTGTDIKQSEVSPNNTVYALPACNAEGDNVFVDGKASKFVLTDAVTSHYPAFSGTATTASYDRSFTAGNWSTICLPVGCQASLINGKVYQLAELREDYFWFEEVEAIQPNVPYLVKLDGSNLFLADEGTFNVGAADSAATKELSVSDGQLVQVGTFVKQTNASTDSQTYYGYQGGEFKKANTGTLNPYRTCFYVNSSSTRAYSLGIEGETTGIDQVTSDKGQLTIDNAPAFDLQGRRVRNAEHGTYIIGGKKIILK